MAKKYYKDILNIKPPTQEQIDKWNEERRQRVDYQVGDWVETCHMLPAIVQEIDIEDDCVRVYYPHYGFTPECIGQYTGRSNCSIDHCGVHKITPQYAIKLMSLGEKLLTERWNSLVEEEKEFDWEEEVEKLYNEHYKDYERF